MHGGCKENQSFGFYRILEILSCLLLDSILSPDLGPGCTVQNVCLLLQRPETVLHRSHLVKSGDRQVFETIYFLSDPPVIFT